MSTKITNGLVLSICIADYLNKETYRKGCDKDIANIHKTFGVQGFDYEIIENNKKTVNINDYLQLVSQAKNKLLSDKSYDGFILIFSGHGSQSRDKYSSDICLSPTNKNSHGENIPIKKILDEFRNGSDGLGKTFLGKPRIFIIQACRGSENAQVIKDDSKTSVDSTQGDNHKQPDLAQYNPDEDVILLQSTTQGYVSYRNEETGSYLITAVTEVLANQPNMSFDDVSYKIKQQVKTLSKAKQAVQLTTTAQKPVFLCSNIMLAAEIDLYIGCPACYDDDSPSYWTHRSCGSRTTIKGSGNISCRNKCHDTPFMDNKWACSKHRNEYRKTSNLYSAANLNQTVTQLAIRLSDGDCKDKKEINTLLQVIKRLQKQIK